MRPRHRPAHGRDGGDRVCARLHPRIPVGTARRQDIAIASSNGCAASSASSRRTTTGSSSACSCRWDSSGSVPPSTATHATGRLQSSRRVRPATVGTPTASAETSTTTCRSRSTPTDSSSPHPAWVTETPPTRWVERSRAFAPQFRHWFASDGAAVPLGRSLTYRFATSSFWGALALADVDALDWAAVRGLALRNLRWWSTQPISDRDGVLSVGFTYDNRRLVGDLQLRRLAVLVHEGVCDARRARRPPVLVSGGSAADTATVHLGPGSEHGAGSGRPPGSRAQRATSRRMVVRRSRAKRSTRSSRTRAGTASVVTSPCSVPSASPTRCSPSPMRTTGERRVRTATTRAEVHDGVALARWSPFPGVTVDTALAGGAPWHVRVHRITTDRALALSETGFALPWTPGDLRTRAHRRLRPWSSDRHVALRRDDDPRPHHWPRSRQRSSRIESQRQLDPPEHDGALPRRHARCRHPHPCVRGRRITRS